MWVAGVDSQMQNYHSGRLGVSRSSKSYFTLMLLTGTAAPDRRCSTVHGSMEYIPTGPALTIQSTTLIGVRKHEHSLTCFNNVGLLPKSKYALPSIRHMGANVDASKIHLKKGPRGQDGSHVEKMDLTWTVAAQTMTTVLVVHPRKVRGRKTGGKKGRYSEAHRQENEGDSEGEKCRKGDKDGRIKMVTIHADGTCMSFLFAF
ncbi:hypothetical protein BU17DRAFT_61864 [Hysterangium stoloniferum]|nr:hypothetical protein BU17DRAFT_61864 [Hysterangium stoloniferum]